MIRLKRSIIVCSLFALLFVVISVPVFLMEHQKEFSLGEVVPYSVEAVQLGRNEEGHSESPAAETLSIWERIKLLGSSVPTAVTGTHANTETQVNNMLSVLEEQLRSLVSFSALPDFSFSDEVSISFAKETYMPISSDGYVNLIKPDHMINIWKIQAEYQDFRVLAYMDTEISAIYNITISSKGAHFLYPSSVSEVGFLEYLLEFSDGENKSGDVFSAGGFYSGKMICLYPLSVDKQTGQIVSYRIGGPYDMEPLDPWPLDPNCGCPVCQKLCAPSAEGRGDAGHAAGKVSEYRVLEMPPTEN